MTRNRVLGMTGVAVLTRVQYFTGPQRHVMSLLVYSLAPDAHTLKTHLR